MSEIARAARASDVSSTPISRAQVQLSNRSERRPLPFIVCLVLGAGCTVPSVKLDAKRCPCASGWICDPSTGTCSTVTQGPADAGAGGPDAAVDGATPPTLTDAGDAQAPEPDAGDAQGPGTIDRCPDDPNKLEPGTCGCGKPDEDLDKDGNLDCVSKDAGTGGEPPEERTIFFESFEDPDTDTRVNLSPSGWVLVGHPSYVSIVDESVGTFATPYGQQVLDLYTAAPPTDTTSLTTTASKLAALLEAKVTYTLTFHVAKHDGKSATGYTVELLAIDDQTGVETVLDAASGSTVDTTDMTQSDRIVFATGLIQANLGQRIAIRLMKDPSAEWMSNPLFDGVRLTMRNEQR